MGSDLFLTELCLQRHVVSLQVRLLQEMQTVTHDACCIMCRHAAMNQHQTTMSKLLYSSRYCVAVRQAIESAFAEVDAGAADRHKQTGYLC